MKRFSVGIDLGTTNTVVAYAEPGGDEIRLFEIDQLVAPGEIQPRVLLPSLRFHPAPGELPENDMRLPWVRPDGSDGSDGNPDAGPAGAPAVIGALARTLGAQVPGRLVASAKSWLSHAAVDRLAPILPWGAGPDVPKISPMEASASYLAHLRSAWNWRFPHAPLEEQDIVLTVPASFDEGARALTVSAARLAGLPRLRLLEEPQAAFYNWLHRHRTSLSAELAQTRLVLVCDVGGGTTDLTLIRVAMRDGEPELTRIGVGKHLMLGGDNMDLALAHLAEARLANGAQDAPARLSATRLSQLIERCRSAKEQLLAADAPERVAVTLLGSGGRLIGGARSVELTREEARSAILDGFFPRVAADEQPRQRRAGIVEFGLPYAGDPAVTRHLAGFLGRHASAVREALGGDGSAGADPGVGVGAEGGARVDAGRPAAPDRPAIPDALLLNGGVFRASVLADRLESTLAAWRGAPLRRLRNDNPDVAVARGAVAYALAQAGRGIRIGGGSPRSYFLMLDERAERGVCVLPRGAEPGREIVLEDRVFALRLGRPVRFHLLASSADEGAQPPHAGEIADLGDAGRGDFVRLPPIAAVLRADAGAKDSRQEVPVRLATSLTEVGTLEMHCVSTVDPERRWLLEFQLRGDGGDPPDAAPDEDLQAMPPRLDDALARIERLFGARAQKAEPREIRQLRAQLEKLLGPREAWTTPLLRRLFDALWQRAAGRRRSAEHERAWLNLAGYCLRPGIGYPLDDWRIGQLWPLFEAGAQYRNDSQVRTEWWTLWRRVAGGLDRDAQLRLLDDFAFIVQEDQAEPAQRPQGLVKGSRDDMLRLAASLERIPAEYKAEIGEWVLGLLKKGASRVSARAVAGTANASDASGAARAAIASDNLVLWTLARIGARQPFHGSAHDVVPPEVAARWLDLILGLDWKRLESAPFAAAHLARLTGDRSRDLPAELRGHVIERLVAIGATPAWIAMIRETVQLDESGQRSFLGDSLPPGLKLIG